MVFGRRSNRVASTHTITETHRLSPPISPSLPPTYAMYEPHLVDFANQHSHDNEGMSLLEELDKIAPIKRFDAFPKVRLLFLVPAR